MSAGAFGRAALRDRDFVPSLRRRQGRRYVNIREAAERLGLSPRILDTYRCTGEGPWFHRFGGCVRYRQKDLDAWDARRRRPRGREASRQASP